MSIYSIYLDYIMQKELHSRENKMTKADARKAVLRIAQGTIQQSIWLDEPGRIEWADDGKLLKALYDLVDQVYQEGA